MEVKQKAQKSSSLMHNILASTVGGFITAAVTTPLDVIKSRLQAQNYPSGVQSSQLQFKGTWDALVKIAQKEGILSLWRGFQPSLLMTVPNVVIYFTCYEGFKEYLESSSPFHGSVLPPIISGLFARSITVSITNPLELIRTNMQANPFDSSSKTQGLFHILRQVFTQGGVRALWGGLPVTLLRDGPFSAIYWSLYEVLKAQSHKQFHEQMNVAHISFYIHFLCGGIAGATACVLTNPLDVIKTRQQMNLIRTQRKPILELFQSIKSQEGWAGFSRGLVPRTSKVAPACAIMISCYELVKRFLYLPQPPPQGQVLEEVI